MAYLKPDARGHLKAGMPTAMTALSAVRPNQTLHEWVAADLRLKIESSELSPGERLPSRQRLAEQYGVSTITVREALRRLAAEGYILSRRGSGCYVDGKDVLASGDIDGARNQSVNGGNAYALGRASVEKTFSNMVAVLTPLTEALSGADAARFQLLEQGALNEVRRAGSHALALHPDRLNDEEIERLAEMGVRGVIIGEFGADTKREVACAQLLANHGVAVVMYGEGEADEFEAFDRVVSDHESGAYDLARWLIEQGRKRILNVWGMPAQGYWFAQRYKGYERAMREAGLEVLAPIQVPPTPLTTSSSCAPFEQHARFMAGFLIEHLRGSESVDAIMAGTDRDTFGVLAACRLLGKEPGRDVSLVGYDDYWKECEERAFEPCSPQATVSKRTAQIGRELATLLFERTQGSLPAPAQRRVVTPQIVVTRSSARSQLPEE